MEQNVWDLYGEKIQAWCDHEGLKLETVIAPGNEDQKTMENMNYMLDWCVHHTILHYTKILH